MRPIGDSSVRKYTQARTVATLLHRNYTFSDAMTQYRYSLPADSMRSLPIDSCAIVVDWVARIKQRVLFVKHDGANPSSTQSRKQKSRYYCTGSKPLRIPKGQCMSNGFQLLLSTTTLPLYSQFEDESSEKKGGTNPP